MAASYACFRGVTKNTKPNSLMMKERALANAKVQRRAAVALAATATALFLLVAAVLLLAPSTRGSLAMAGKPVAGSGAGVSPGGSCDPSLTIQPPYDATYSCTSLGSVAGLPPNYGGLVFLNGDPNTLLIAGNANTETGALYKIGVVRDGTGHIIGFSGEVSRFADAAYNDGGIVYGPDGILFLARWPVNAIGQTRPGSSVTDKIVDMTPFQVCPAIAALNFVPLGFPGAGQLKLVSWSEGCWYTAAIAPDGNGTYDVTSTITETTITGGPEGFIYVPPGSPSFPDFDSMLVAEYSAGNIAAYALDDNGDPEPASRATFIAGLSGAEGAAIDPLTGDFLFSTFGGGNQVVAIRGFAAPPTPTPTGEPATPAQTSTTAPPTETPVSPTATATIVPATATNTVVAATVTPVSPTATRTRTRTPVAPPTSPPTSTPTATPPPTRTPTSTPIGPPTAVPTSTLPPTATPPATATSTLSPPEATATAEVFAAIAGANATVQALSREATATALSAEATATAEIAAAATTSRAEAAATAISQSRTATARAPTPTRESDVLGAVTPGPSAGDGSSRAKSPAFGVDSGQPETTAAVLGFDQVSKNPKVIGTNIVLAIILLLLLLFSSTVFNETVNEHRLELQGHAMRLTAPFAGFGERARALWPAGRSVGSRLNLLLGPLLLLGVTAFVYSLNEPHLGFDGQTALLFSSLLIAIGVLTYVVEGGEAVLTQRRFGVDAGIRLVPIAIAMAAGFVVLSRLVHFEAPIMYGFIASATVLGVAGLDRKDAATAVVVPAIALLAVSIGAWLLLQPLRDATQHESAWWAHVPSEAGAAIFVGGIEGLLFVLLPLRFTDGEKIWHWYRWLWFPLFGISAFFFCWVILNPQAKALDALLEGRVVFIASLVCIYAAVAGLFWAYFLLRRRSQNLTRT